MEEHEVVAVVEPVQVVVESLEEHVLVVEESLVEGMPVVVYAGRVVEPLVEVFLGVAEGRFQVVPVLVVVVLLVVGSLNRVEGTPLEVKMEEVH